MVGKSAWQKGAALGVWLFAALPGVAEEPDWVERLTILLSPELREIGSEIEEIDSELEVLPVPLNINSGMTRGFQTGLVKEGEDMWVEIELPETVEADRVVLFPMLAKGREESVSGHGFPRRFKLEAMDAEGAVVLLADESGGDFPNPGLYPVVVKCPPGIRIGRIRLTVISQPDDEEPKLLALAEMMVLKGNQNVALGGAVTASSSRELKPTWARNNLLDMVTPLGLPVEPPGGQLLGWCSEDADNPDTVKTVTLDLGREVRLDEVRIAPAWQHEMPGQFGYGFPSKFAVSTAKTLDGKNDFIIHDQRQEALLSPGQNLQCYPTGSEEVRYIRVQATHLRMGSGNPLFALGEIQAYSGGKNVAVGAKVICEESLENEKWGRAALTDGLMRSGHFLELPEWIDGLVRRGQLEVRRAGLKGKRATLLALGERILLGGSVGVTCGVGLLAGIMLLRVNRQRRTDRERHRERLARDLHDEIGSNLGSIALISAFAVEGKYDQGQMRQDLVEIERVARESADSMRDMVEVLGGGRGGATSDWLGVMEKLAERLLRGVELDCRLPDGTLKVEPDLETRREIYLFCKEVLHNIAKHAGARKVRFYLKAIPEGLWVEIADDGCGFDQKMRSTGHGLGNLKERAAGLRANFDFSSSPGVGTVVRLEIPRARRWRKVNPSKRQ
ncbi:MAG: histidine kinase [Akkermansiaceae bacterium]|nr:histidine kinase [Akkermansiaceae bacterium]MDP4846473.1 histidine kinase [Akkermansiaceae bacterium]